LHSTNQPEQILSTGAVAIAAGTYHSLFLKSDGSLWGMGADIYGQLGDGFDHSSTNSESLRPLQIVPTPMPALGGRISSETDLQFTATCGFGGFFYLLTSSNLAQPRNQWVPVWTNSIDTRSNNNFNVTLSNAANSQIGRQFFILQSP
jgi:hypothetical protein